MRIRREYERNKWLTDPEWKARKQAALKKWFAKNKDKRREYNRKWTEKNREKVRAKSREYSRKRRASYTAEDKARVTAAVIASQAKKIQRTPAWCDLRKCAAFYIQASRLSKSTGIPHQVDHIIPLNGTNVSGLHVHNNLQVLTAEQNLVKTNSYSPEI